MPLILNVCTAQYKHVQTRCTGNLKNSVSWGDTLKKKKKHAVINLVDLDTVFIPRCMFICTDILDRVTSERFKHQLLSGLSIDYVALNTYIVIKCL